MPAYHCHHYPPTAARSTHYLNEGRPRQSNMTFARRRRSRQVVTSSTMTSGGIRPNCRVSNHPHGARQQSSLCSHRGSTMGPSLCKMCFLLCTTRWELLPWMISIVEVDIDEQSCGDKALLGHIILRGHRRGCWMLYEVRACC